MNERLLSLLQKETALQQQIMTETNPEQKVSLLDKQYELLLKIEKILAQTKPIFLT